MSNTADMTYELLKRVHSDVGEMKRDMSQIKQRLGSLEQHQATMLTDLVRINADLDEMRSDLSRIKTRLDLVEA